MICVKSFEVQLLQQISSHMNEGTVGLICLDITKLAQLEVKYGRTFCERMALAARTFLEELRPLLPNVFSVKSVGDVFFVYAAFEGSELNRALRQLEETSQELKLFLESRLRPQFPAEPQITVSTGSALLFHSSERELESILYSAVKEAIRQARSPSHSLEEAALVDEFDTILAQRNVSPVYQPILSLSDGKLFGYEAFTRGPVQSYFRSPVQLFTFAEREGKLGILDNMTREEAVSGCSGMGNHQRLFLNVPARMFHDPRFTPGRTLELLQHYGLKPGNIVFEITDRNTIEDFPAARQIIDQYRNQGCLIATDDAGSGYSSLQAIAEIQPDFIKLDRSHIVNIHKDKVKEYVLETFITFAKRLNIKLIAEGIEQTDDLAKLIKMGVHYGQGYLLGYPAAELAEADPSVRESIARLNERTVYSGNALMIGDIVSPIKTFGSGTYTSEVVKYFREHGDETGAVILQEDKPVGLMSRDNLFRKLAVQYGISLYWNKEISHLMDENPLIVDFNTPLENVSQLAMTRESGKLYDLVVVTKGDKLAGAVTVRAILENITNIRMEHARVANPLTGLPGNVQIQRELNRRLLSGEPFSVIYIDLDYFKWFNDYFGFQRGDEVIQFTAEVVQHSTEVCGNSHDFVGHIGGDDFIVITAAEQPDTICSEIIRRFVTGIPSYYEGQLTVDFVQDRNGNKVESDGIAVSLSLVNVTETQSVTVDMISRAAAVCKKKAKSRKGNVWVSQNIFPASSVTGANAAKR
ncbi:GGDEF domain-containing protein [Paenibacillus alkalitolerans]|uniref:GGDEF domain-containing protein n=1 Tax=Paenibacillus alkalitolerans TaxID=2799335 RepID=UPI0018F28155|nr:GGDEF domain-containing protein [Paenibacillus alkalitolerans]